MRKPPRFWESTFASLPFVRRRNNKPRPRARTGRPMMIESLEPRQLLSAAPTLYWDPGQTGPTTGVASGGSSSVAWDDTSGSNVWYDSATAVNADVAWSNGDTAVFEGQTGTVTISGTVTAANIIFASPNYKIAGGTLDLIPADGSQATITVGSTGSAASATISSSLADTAAGASPQDNGPGLTVHGNGAVLLDGNNSISGGMTTDSPVIFGQPGAMPYARNPQTSPGLDINPGGQVTLGMPTLYADAGGGTEDWATADIWHLGNAYGLLTTWIDGSYATLGGGGGGTLDLSTPVIASAVTFAADGYTIHGDASGDTLTGPTIGLDAGAGTTSTIDAVLSGSGGLAVSGPGILVLGCANNYTGPTTINGSYVTAGDDAALGAANPLTMSKSTLDLNGMDLTVASLTGDAASLITSTGGAGQLTVALASGTSTFAGTIADGASTSGGHGDDYGGGGTLAPQDVVEFYLQPVSLGTTNYSSDFEMDSSDNISVNNVTTSDASGTIYFDVYAGLNLSGGASSGGVETAELNFTSTGAIGDGSTPSSLGLAFANGFGDGPAASTGDSTDLNDDGNLDLGSTGNANPAGWADFCQNPGVIGTASGSGSGDCTNVLLGVLAYNYSDADDGQTAQVTLDSRTGTFAPVFMYELDGVAKADTFHGSKASDLAIGTPVTITYAPAGGLSQASSAAGGLSQVSSDETGTVPFAPVAVPDVSPPLTISTGTVAIVVAGSGIPGIPGTQYYYLQDGRDSISSWDGEIGTVGHSWFAPSHHPAREPPTTDVFQRWRLRGLFGTDGRLVP